MDMPIAWIIAGGIVFLYVVGTFNSLVRKRAQTQESWSTIDTQLKRRYDLIPTLIQTVKGYAQHERQTLERIVAARNAGATILAGQDIAQIAQNERNWSQCLRSIAMLKEAYPELKANQNFIALQSEMANTENKIQAYRQFYNTCVLSLNTAVASFPGNIVAGIFGFKHAKYFEIDGSEKQNPTTGF